LRCSSNDAHAAPLVKARIASPSDSRSFGSQPPAGSPSKRVRLTATKMPRIGSSGATGQSDPKASGAPLFSRLADIQPRAARSGPRLMAHGSVGSGGTPCTG
jgi:hypothetical protein